MGTQSPPLENTGEDGVMGASGVNKGIQGKTIPDAEQRGGEPNSGRALGPDLIDYMP